MGFAGRFGSICMRNFMLIINPLPQSEIQEQIMRVAAISWAQFAGALVGVGYFEGTENKSGLDP